jgi:hypothetical protein
MKNARLLYVAAAVSAAYLATPMLRVTAKEDPAKQAADREALRKEYTAAKKYIDSSFTYFVDLTKLKDERWTITSPTPSTVKGSIAPSMTAVLSPNPSDASASVSLLIYRSLQADSAAKTVANWEFKAWGKQVKVSDVGEFAQGWWEEFMRTATDPIKEKSKAPQKVSIGPAKLWAYAVGTDKELQKRVKKDWYVWMNSDKSGGYTWWVDATTSEKLFESKDFKEWAERLEDFVAHLADLKDPRAKQ